MQLLMLDLAEDFLEEAEHEELLGLHGADVQALVPSAAASPEERP